MNGFARVARDSMRYAVVGSIATLLDVATFNLVLLAQVTSVGSMEPIWAKFVAAISAGVFSFSFHKRWTFRERKGDKHLTSEVLLFVVVTLVGLAITISVIFVCNNLLGLTSAISLNVANLLALGMSNLFRFVALRQWVFK